MAQIYGFYAYRQARGRKFSAAGRCPPPPAGGWGGLARVQGRAAVSVKLCHIRCTHVQHLLHACATSVARTCHDCCTHVPRLLHAVMDGMAPAWGTAWQAFGGRQGVRLGIKKPGKPPSFRCLPGSAFPPPAFPGGSHSSTRVTALMFFIFRRLVQMAFTSSTSCT